MHSHGGRLRHCSVVTLLLLVAALWGCAAPAPKPVAAPTLSPTLNLYNWPGYMPQTVLDAFEAESGVHVTVSEYGAMEEAVVEIRQGRRFDVAVVEQDVIPVLVGDQKLAHLDLANIPNLRNISPAFRNLAFDPDNHYSIPYHWGTSALIVRTDLLPRPIERWADLWDPAFAGQVALRQQEVELIGVTMLALGLPLNASDEASVAAAGQKLLELHPAALLDEADGSLAIPALAAGEVSIFLGWPVDGMKARDEVANIDYVFPAEGAPLWQDAFVVSAGSEKKYTAELFINFLLRPDIGARLINENYAASANEAAALLADPAIVGDPIIYPLAETVRKSQWFAPISAETQRRYDEIWAKFLAANQHVMR
jgi:spermidine/putrescine transport system substrate-binding protein